MKEVSKEEFEKYFNSIEIFCAESRITDNNYEKFFFIGDIPTSDTLVGKIQGVIGLGFKGREHYYLFDTEQKKEPPKFPSGGIEKPQNMEEPGDGLTEAQYEKVDLEKRNKKFEAFKSELKDLMEKYNFGKHESHNYNGMEEYSGTDYYFTIDGEPMYGETIIEVFQGILGKF